MINALVTFALGLVIIAFAVDMNTRLSSSLTGLVVGALVVLGLAFIGPVSYFQLQDDLDIWKARKGRDQDN